MKANESHLQITAVLTQIPIACDFVASAAVRAGLDDHAVYHCQLAVDEACTNIVEHAYRIRGDRDLIDIFCRADSDRFTITIMDDGPAFDPLTQFEPDPAASLEKRGSGGWGIHFIRKLMDEVAYSRQDKRNCLFLAKHRPVLR